jgi:hypothetical protein
MQDASGAEKRVDRQEKYNVSKIALRLGKLIYNYSDDMYSVLNCHNVAKHTEFYLGCYGSMRLPLIMQGVS